jgi:hypothetical protein
MNYDRRSRWGGAFAALMIMALAPPLRASGSADGKEIRVLLVASRDADLDMQITLLARAIRQSPGPLVLAGGLSDAHVVVEFTRYRRATGKDGQPLSEWFGNAKLLKVPEQMTVSATPLSERFELMVIGHEGSESQRALKLLETNLTKTLRPKARTAPKEAL